MPSNILSDEELIAENELRLQPTANKAAPKLSRKEQKRAFEKVQKAYWEAILSSEDLGVVRSNPHEIPVGGLSDIDRVLYGDHQDRYDEEAFP